MMKWCNSDFFFSYHMIGPLIDVNFKGSQNIESICELLISAPPGELQLLHVALGSGVGLVFMGTSRRPDREESVRVGFWYRVARNSSQQVWSFGDAE